MQFRSVVAIIAAVALCAPVAPARADVGQRWRAGYQSIEASGNRRTPNHIAVWYPTTASEQPWRSGPFGMHVAADAPLAEGLFPVIALSHGAFGRPINHRDLAIALARAGYIVVAPHHDPLADAAGFSDRRQREGRPAALLFSLRAVHAHPRFAPHFDTRRIGAVGYSAGGYSVLAAMHARATWTDVAGHCLLHFFADRRFCSDGGGGQDRRHGTADALTGPASVNAAMDATAELRIRAAVLLAPVAAVFSAAGLTRVRAPIRIYSADNDQMLNSRFHGDWLFTALRAQGTPVERIATHGGHHVFMSAFPPAIQAEVGPAAQDPPGFDREAFQQRIARDTIAFFARTLRR